MRILDFICRKDILSYALNIIPPIKKHIDYVKKLELSNHIKTYFMRAAAHDLNNLLTRMLGNIDLIMASDPPESLVESLNIISDSGKYAAALTCNLSCAGEIEDSRIQPDLANYDLKKTLKFFKYNYKERAESKGIVISYDAYPDDINNEIMTDHVKLSQILDNLVGNSVKFTDKGSVIFGVNKKDENLEFYVKDTGIGIPEAEQCKIFDIFSQGKNIPRTYGGRGIGLFITKTLVEIMGGRIWLESQEGVGTSFFFTHPYRQPDAGYKR